MPLLLKSDLSSVLANLIRLSNSNTQFEFKVNAFLTLLNWELDLEHSVLLTADREKDTLVPHWRPEDNVPHLSPLPLNGNLAGRCFKSREALLAEPHDLESMPPDWKSFLKPFKNGLIIVPVTDDKAVYGALMLINHEPYKINGSMTLLMEAVANELALAIKNFHMAIDIRKRLTISNVLSNLWRTLSSTIDLDKVMSIIPQVATGIFLAEGCTVNILDESGQRLVKSSQYGAIPPSYNFERYSESKSLPPSVAAALQRKTSYGGYLKDDPNALDLAESELYHTIVSSPLAFQSHHQGSISLFNKLSRNDNEITMTPQLFTNDDMELLLSTKNMITGVVENTIAFKEVESLARTNEKMVDYLSILYDISSAMLTSVKYDELFWIILRALTERNGLGFDQAMILILEKDGGEDSLPSLRSHAVWSGKNDGHTGDSQLPLAEFLKNPLKEEAAQMMKRGHDLAIKIPVFPNSTRILSRVLIENKPMLGFRAFDVKDDLEFKDFGLKSYAAAPMIAKNGEVGVIAVDRSHTGIPLTQDDLRDLNMLASQAALSLEGAWLYNDLETANQTLSQVRNRLIEAEKVAAQGEMGTQLAHDVRNPLVSIGGFAKRLLKKMTDGDPLKKYAEVILEEVERVNKVLNNILDFSRDEKGILRKFKMNELVDETLASLKHELGRNKVNVTITAEPNLPEVVADDRQVMHLILNLIYNSSQAMPGGGKIYVKLYQTLENDQIYVACEITDTGPGVPDDILANIFTPFFTNKTNGTGLGLSIVKKIVDRYHGFISVRNHPPEIEGSGASFTFMFPKAISESGLYVV